MKGEAILRDETGEALLPRLRYVSTVADEALNPATEIIGRVTPEQKLQASMRLYWSARALEAAWFRSEHPEWTEAQVNKAVRDAFLFHRD